MGNSIYAQRFRKSVVNPVRIYIEDYQYSSQSSKEDVCNEVNTSAGKADNIQDHLEDGVGYLQEYFRTTAQEKVFSAIDYIYYDKLHQSTILTNYVFKRYDWDRKWELYKKECKWYDYGPPYSDDDELHSSLLSTIKAEILDMYEVNRLLTLGANPNHRDPTNDNSCVHYAVLKSNLDLLDLLLRAGGKVNVRNRLRQTPLQFACEGKLRVNTVMVRKLLKFGANVNVKDKAGATPFVYAISRFTSEDTIDIIRYLLSAGGIVNPQNEILHLEDPNPLEILKERIEDFENIALYEGRTYYNVPRHMRTSDMRIYDLLFTKDHIRKAEKKFHADVAKAKDVVEIRMDLQRQKRLQHRMKIASIQSKKLKEKEQKAYSHMQHQVKMLMEEEEMEYDPSKRAKQNADKGEEYYKDKDGTWKRKSDLNIKKVGQGLRAGGIGLLGNKKRKQDRRSKSDPYIPQEELYDDTLYMEEDNKFENEINNQIIQAPNLMTLDQTKDKRNRRINKHQREAQKANKKNPFPFSLNFRNETKTNVSSGNGTTVKTIVKEKKTFEQSRNTKNRLQRKDIELKQQEDQQWQSQQNKSFNQKEFQQFDNVKAQRRRSRTANLGLFSHPIGELE